MQIASRIKDHPALVRQAQQAGKSVQGSLDRLVGELGKGNFNPGIGTKHLFGEVFEARARDGARVYCRKTPGLVEVLGKSSKANQKQVINTLQKVYGE